MKKLFFTALVAAVAIGGAFANSESNLIPGSLWVQNNSSSTPDFTCNGGTPSCSLKYPGQSQDLYDAPQGTPGRQQVELEDFTYTP